MSGPEQDPEAKAAARVDRTTLFRQGGTLLVGRAVLAISRSAAVLVLARVFGPEVQGGFTLISSLLSFGVIVLSLGLDSANAWVVGSDPQVRHLAFGNTMLLAVAVLFLSPGWVSLSEGLFPQLLTGLDRGLPAWVPVVLLSLGLASLCAKQMLTALAIGALDFRRVMWADILWGGAWLIGLLVTVQVSYLGVLVAFVLAVTLSWFYLAQGEVRRREPGWDSHVFRRQVGYGVRTLGGGVARALNLRLSLYLAAFFLSPAEVGLYGVLVLCTDLFLYLPTALGQVTLGHSSSGRSRRSGRVAVYLVLTGTGVAASFMASLLGDRILEFAFGPAYAAGATALAVLFGAVTLHSVGLVRLHDLLGVGRPWVATGAQILTLAVLAISAAILLPRYGLTGAAWSTFLAYTAFAIFLFASPRNPPATAALSGGPT